MRGREGCGCSALRIYSRGLSPPVLVARGAGWVHGGSHSSARHNPTPSRNATETLLLKALLGVGKGQGSWVTSQRSRSCPTEQQVGGEMPSLIIMAKKVFFTRHCYHGAGWRH